MQILVYIIVDIVIYCRNFSIAIMNMNVLSINLILITYEMASNFLCLVFSQCFS